MPLRMPESAVTRYTTSDSVFSAPPPPATPGAGFWLEGKDVATSDRGRTTCIGGANRRDDRLFSGQLAGEFLSRYAGWGDVLPLNKAKSAIDEQLSTSVIGTPDFYAPKVREL